MNPQQHGQTDARGERHSAALILENGVKFIPVTQFIRRHLVTTLVDLKEGD